MATSENQSIVPRRGFMAWRHGDTVGVASAVLIGVVLLWTLRGQMGMVWDEPPDIQRQYQVQAWCKQLLASPTSAWTPAALAQGWPFAGTAPHEHPPLYALLGLFTYLTTGWLLDPLEAHRLATVLVLCVTTGALFHFFRRRWGVWPASAGVAALLGNPRLFGDAQLVTLDFLVGAMMVFAALTLGSYAETGRRPWQFGLLVGLAIMSKATGILILPFLLLWSAMFRFHQTWRAWLWGLATIPAVMLGLHPGWWRQPIAGPLGWAKGLLDYQQKPPTYYLGEVYDFRERFLPWHNPFVLTGIMIPIGLLLLGIAGLISLPIFMRRRCRSATASQTEKRPLSDAELLALGAIPFAGWLGLRMFHFMPGHDGLRQLTPAFVCFPWVVAGGVHFLLHLSSGIGWQYLARAAVIVGLGTSVWETIRIHPFELAYYNPLIGGPIGAKARGFESTYYWDAVHRPVLDWMNANLPSGARVLIFPPPDVRIFDWQQRWGWLRQDLRFVNHAGEPMENWLAPLKEDPRTFLIFQMRQSLFMPRQLGSANFLARLADADASFEVKPKAVGIRLLAIYSRDDFQRFLAQLAAGPASNPPGS